MVAVRGFGLPEGIGKLLRKQLLTGNMPLTLVFLKAATVTWYFTGTAMDMGWLSK